MKEQFSRGSEAWRKPMKPCFKTGLALYTVAMLDVQSQKELA